MNSTPATALVRADDATAYLLGLALFDRDVAERIARTMRPDDFPDSRERQIFVAMVAVLSEGHAPDPATVLAKMPHGAKPRNHLYSLLEARGQKSNVDVYVEIARQASAKRWQLRTAIEICDYVGNANGTPADEIQRHVAEVWAGAPLAQPGSRLSVEGSEATFLDWSTFWKHDPREAADWLLNDVLARGRGHVIYASHKDGKSLFMLWIAGQLATGPEPVVVIYLDYEMTQSDVRERLEDMGHGPDTDFSRLRYALLPTIPPLDRADGATALMAMVDRVQSEWLDHHVVVVVDTFGRAVDGPESEADTVRDFYSHTGIALKRRGVTWVRLDHAGYDQTHQRGSTAKGDDPDVIWRLTKTQNGICLKRDAARMNWVPDRVSFGMSDNPLHYQRLADGYPPGTGELAKILDRLELSLNASRPKAEAALKTINEGRSHALVSAALRYRRDRL